MFPGLRPSKSSSAGASLSRLARRAAADMGCQWHAASEQQGHQFVWETHAASLLYVSCPAKISVGQDLGVFEKTAVLPIPCDKGLEEQAR